VRKDFEQVFNISVCHNFLTHAKNVKCRIVTTFENFKTTNKIFLMALHACIFMNYMKLTRLETLKPSYEKVGCKRLMVIRIVY